MIRYFMVAMWVFSGVAFAQVAQSDLPRDVSDSGALQSPEPALVDDYPLGCISCHTNMPEIGVDARLSTAMREWSREVPAPLLAIAEAATAPGATLAGKHPLAVNSLQDIPAACLDCHRSDADAIPSFARVVHLAHLTGADENHFLTLFHGECRHCHKLDKRTGEWRMPSGPEPSQVGR